MEQPTATVDSNPSLLKDSSTDSFQNILPDLTLCQIKTSSRRRHFANIETLKNHLLYFFKTCVQKLSQEHLDSAFIYFFLKYKRQTKEI